MDLIRIPTDIPQEAEIAARSDDGADVFTLQLRLCSPQVAADYRFQPGQFNMIYLFGIGEVPISIVSDPETPDLIGHTIRAVGRVTRGIAALRVGQRLGLRGPYGRGWPLDRAVGRDVLVLTGGLGCAPSVSVIDYITRRRSQYGHLYIMQGVKHHKDLLWRERYAAWAAQPDTQVVLSSDVGAAPLWPWHVGPVTAFFDQLHFDPARLIVMMCGPEGMMKAAVKALLDRGVSESSIWLSMERNMQCAVAQCGHCQYGGLFVCRDGPVFNYPEVSPYFEIKGF